LKNIIENEKKLEEKSKEVKVANLLSQNWLFDSKEENEKHTEPEESKEDETTSVDEKYPKLTKVELGASKIVSTSINASKKPKEQPKEQYKEWNYDFVYFYIGNTIVGSGCDVRVTPNLSDRNANPDISLSSFDEPEKINMNIIIDRVRIDTSSLPKEIRGESWEDALVNRPLRIASRSINEQGEVKLINRFIDVWYNGEMARTEKDNPYEATFSKMDLRFGQNFVEMVLTF